jgi:hypothetical protein
MTLPNDDHSDRWLAPLLAALHISHGPVTADQITEAGDVMLDAILAARDAETKPRPIRETLTD